MNDPRGHRFLPYHPDAYDEHFALRIPLTLWAVLLYALHAECLLLLGHLPQAGAELGYLLAYVAPNELVASLPALAVLVAALRRRPTAGRLPRFVWRQGAWLLLASLVADLALALTSRHGAWAAARVAGDLASIAVVVTSARIRDTFADFPRLPV
ncbi:MAG: DUF2919 domain-containing protein [Gammaproteobacteria bacterium]|nr:DUF2919 domain-containing protein [Gammaproteobacteria bacterium]